MKAHELARLVRCAVPHTGMGTDWLRDIQTTTHDLMTAGTAHEEIPARVAEWAVTIPDRAALINIYADIRPWLAGEEASLHGLKAVARNLSAALIAQEVTHAASARG